MYYSSLLKFNNNPRKNYIKFDNYGVTITSNYNWFLLGLLVSFDNILTKYKRTVSLQTFTNSAIYNFLYIDYQMIFKIAKQIIPTPSNNVI